MILLAAFDVWFNLGMMAFFGVCLLLILMIMIQKPQGGGLSAAFGASSGSGQTAFGTKTGDALTVATIILFAVWILVATVLNLSQHTIHNHTKAVYKKLGVSSRPELLAMFLPERPFQLALLVT